MQQVVIGNTKVVAPARAARVAGGAKASVRPAPAFSGMKAVHRMPKALRAKADANTVFMQAAKAAVSSPVATFETPEALAQSLKQETKCMDIVFVSAECAPWSKTGGLGDVVGGLPIELAKRGHRVMTVQPR